MERRLPSTRSPAQSSHTSARELSIPHRIRPQAFPTPAFISTKAISSTFHRFSLDLASVLPGTCLETERRHFEAALELWWAATGPWTTLARLARASDQWRDRKSVV